MDYQKVSSYELASPQVGKVVLLYSGGLDSSVMIRWLHENYGCDVVALTVNLGQPGADLEAIRRKALDIGACKAIVADVVDEFAEQYIFRGIKANACYQGDYYLSTPLGRPLIAKLAVDVALAEGAEAIAHGCTGKGNDQVRLDGGILALCPSMKIIAPVREWNMGRDEELRYAEKHSIPVPASKNSPYSHDDNLWGVTSEGGAIEDPAMAAPVEQALRFITPPALAPDEAENVRIGFEKGVPVSLNGIPMRGSKLIAELNHLAGKHGVGIYVLIEDRIIGSKSRGIYEAPAAAVLVRAHRDLEKIVCTRVENEMKSMIDTKWSYMCYCAQWFEPLMGSLNAFIDNLNQKVTGEVTVNLFKGNAQVLAVESKYSLFDADAAAFDSGGGFNINCAAPFIELYSMASVNAWKKQGGYQHGQ